MSPLFFKSTELHLLWNAKFCHLIKSPVALTARSNGETVNSGDVVKFPNVKTNYGLQNLALFKQTGIFTCEQKGLYMFFSSIVSKTTTPQLLP
jgi:hypothetical protein